MSWQPHGISSSGFLQGAQDGRSKTVPAVAAYRGQLWCLWADMEDAIWYAVTIKEGEFGPRSRFPERGLPVLTNLNGHLHAIITLGTGEMVHYLYDDEDKPAWISLGPVAGAIAHSSPCLAAFHNKLFLVFIRDACLYYQIWTTSTADPTSASQRQGFWSEPTRLRDDGQTFSGIPALFAINGVLHVLCGSSDASREILGFKFDYISSTWIPSDDVSGGRAASGVSATSFGDKAYLGFIENGPGDVSHAVYVAAYSDGKWQPQEDVAGQSAADPPQIAILNGRIHCIFAENTEARDLRWYSRPVLSYSLSSWMQDIADETLISHLTIPGTHDSCARSTIPFVRTQYLSITQQLALGIRFFDLRLRLHDDGHLYCYHGGVLIDFPTGLSFAYVMDEIWTFLRGADGRQPPTETVLISINNDDISPEQQADPALFYSAVQDAIVDTPPYPDGSHRWFVEPVTPTLGEARGRAVLLRRYHGHPAVHPVARQGLDLSKWLNDNPQFTIITPTKVKIHLQDKWRYTDRMTLAQLVANKSGHVQQLMDRAATSPAGVDAGSDAGSDGDAYSDAVAVADADADADGDTRTTTPRPGLREQNDWFINFNSAVGDPAEHGEVMEAKWIAVGAHSNWIGKWVDGMNVRTREYLQELQTRETGTSKRRLGIVNLDFPELPGDNDLVARLIEMNF
ncbi:phosphatidylinositol-specific phospholipase [Coniochaeta ligniaria NRRL 30616]|uniref:Phosphatidylinositol-specific phospholipase n=1 Tax=Coniochaeta ligniaria NRRL 30616 TaxID=1408157 RepID=A0A1J7IY10_9PEZI|nr:phosphatidylinositol-specific phospholipase [Coniochaeta ligniaria NRRL 30616]